MNKRCFALVKPNKHAAILKVLTAVLLIFQINVFAQQAVQYVYDNNGRLRAIAYPNGSLAVYDYDEEGNVIAVRGEQSSTVSIIYFTPNGGIPGTVVQITGTGFSPNATADTVRFNGVAAPVQSATLTQLTVAVPAGATSGTITVTTPTGTAVSSEVFFITGSPTEPPVITDFDPRIGKLGDEISISGINFDPTASNNAVAFSGVSGDALSTSSNNIVAVVPNSATSGKISVSTAAGNVSTEQDFIVVPAGIETASVFFTSRFSLNEIVRVPFSRADKVAMLIFDGVAGQKVGLSATVPTTYYGSLVLPLDLSIKTPDGSILVPATAMSSTQRGLYLEPFILPATGTYTLLLDKTSYPSGVGTATVKVFDVPPDAAGTIEIDGPPVQIANTVPGQNARLTFNGAAGQKINFLGEIVVADDIADFSILNPDGSTLVRPSAAFNSSFLSRQRAFDENIVLPSNGTYTIFINPFNDGVFTSQAELSSPPANVSATMSADGSETVMTTTEPGQNAEAVFNGEVGQRISLTLFNSNGIYNNSITIEAPDGSRLVNNEYTSQKYFLDATTLTQAGIYKVKLNPYGDDVGTMKLRLYAVPPDASAPATIGGPSVTVSITVPGQNAIVTFDGIAGQKIAVKLSNRSFSGYVHIRRLDGTVFSGDYVNAADRLLENITLPSDGSYSVFLDPQNESVGNTTVQIFDANAPDIVSDITADGTPLSLNFSVPFQKAQVSFTGIAGQTLRLAFDDITVPSSRVSVLKPDGTALLSNFTIAPPSAARMLNNLPVSGTYTIVVDPNVEYTGQMSLSLAPIVDFNASIAVDGSPASVNLVENQKANISFNGSAGQRVFIKFTGTNPSVDFDIVRPNGTVMQTGTFYSNSGYDFHTLPETGTYRIRATNSPYQTSSFQVSALSSASIAMGDQTFVKFLNPNRTANVSFQADAGTSVNLIIPNTSFSNGVVNVYSPDNSLLTSVSVHSFYNSFLTQSTGIYRIEVVPAQGETGYVQLNLSSYGGGGDGWQTTE